MWYSEEQRLFGRVKPLCDFLDGQECMADYLESLSNISDVGDDGTLMASVTDTILETIIQSGAAAIVCGPCAEDGCERRAKGYCADCEEYLCETCYNHHQTPRPFRHHFLQELHEIPREDGRHIASDQTLARCSLHPNKKLVSYCQQHDQLCCQTCVLIGHRVCEQVLSVDEVAKGIESNNEFKRFYARLLGMEQQYLTERQNMTSQIEQVDKCYNDALSTFSGILEELKAQDVAQVSAMKSAYDSALCQTSDWIALMESYWMGQVFGQLFMLVKLTSKHLEMIDNNVRQLCKDVAIQRYRFEDETDTDSSTLGVLKTIDLSVRKINVKQSTETFNCIIRDITLLENNIMLVTDYGSNCSIKLVDTKSNNIVSAIGLNSGPWQMTVTDTQEVYVTVPGNRNLLHLRSPTRDVSDLREIPLGEQVVALEYHDNKLKAQCISPCRLLELDLNGRILGVINEDVSATTSPDNRPLVTNPYCSVLNKETGSVIVSCCNQNSVVEISSDGHVNALVKSASLNCPFGLCIDSDGSFFVCSSNGKTVLKVHGDGSIENALPEPLDFIPSALALDTANRHLYIGGNNDSVYVFDV